MNTMLANWPRGRAATRERIARAIAAHGRRERLVLMLMLVERMRPIEIAAALHVSVRQVERTLDTLFDEMARAARRTGPTRLRRVA
jgi:DNA-directed RNA polymerase specialized sigma24 family protein